MFYCIGENKNTRDGFGSGESVEDAIISWGSEETKTQIFDEFEEYSPVVIEGKQLNVAVSISINIAVTQK